MLTRRVILVTPVALMATRITSAASGKMTLAIHQNTSPGRDIAVRLKAGPVRGSRTSNSPTRS
jgi:hypothetical protein